MGNAICCVLAATVKLLSLIEFALGFLSPQPDSSNAKSAGAMREIHPARGHGGNAQSTLTDAGGRRLSRISDRIRDLDTLLRGCLKKRPLP